MAMSDPCELAKDNVLPVWLVITEPFLYHWKVGFGTPEAPETNDADEPAATVILVGCGEMDGGTMTVSVPLLVTTPAALVAINETVMLLKPKGTAVSVRFVLVAPPTSTKLVCHWKVGYGLAITTLALNVILLPWMTV